MGLTQITTGGVDGNINIDSNTLKVDGTNNRVGIGTASPGDKLAISDGSNITELSGFSVYFKSDSTGYIQAGPPSGSSGRLVFQTNSVERMRIDSSGRVGIGTTSPSTLLEIKSDGTAANEARLSVNEAYNSGSSGFGIDFKRTYNTGGANQDAGYIRMLRDGGDSNAGLTFATGNRGSVSERLRIDSSGNVGIGTTSPSQQLHIASANTSSSGTIIASDSQGRGVLIESPYIGNSVGKIGISGTDSALAFGSGSSNTERMRIDSSGRVGINNTSPGLQHFNDLVIGDGSANDAGLTIHTSTSGSGTVAFSDGTSGSSRYDGYLQYDHFNQSFKIYTNGGNERMRIDSSGNVGIGTSGPSYKLHVVNNSSAAARIGGTNNYLELGEYASNSSPAISYNGSGASLPIRNGTSEVARFDPSGRLLVGTSAGTSSGGGAVQTGGGGTMVSNSGNIPNNGTLDITVGTSNLCYWSGFLFVNNINGANGNTRTQSTYSVFGNNQGATAAFTQIATANGGSGSSFTVTYVDNGIIRFTNTSGATCNVSIGFFGGGLNMT